MFNLIGWRAKVGEWLIVLAVAGGIGYYIYDKGYQASESAYIVKQAAADRAQQDKYNLVATELESLKGKREDNVKTITKTLTKIVTRDVYRNVCVDDDGRVLINSALSGKPSSFVDPAVQATSTP